MRAVLAPETGAGGGGDSGTGGGGSGADGGAVTGGAAGSGAGAGKEPAGGAGGEGAGGAGDGGKKPAPLAAGGGDPEAKPAAAPADWPADWREKLAGEDKAFLKTLQRYSSPGDVANWLRTTQLKFSAGEIKEVRKPPGKDAKPEEIAAWRKEQGLPADAGGYIKALKLADGVKPSELDQTLFASFAERALENGMPQEAYDAVVGWFYDTQNKLAEQAVEIDADNRVKAEQELIQKMGADFKPNMSALGSFWSEHPEDVQATILGARTADGRLIGDIPEVTEFFVKLARELNPAAAILPVGHGANLQSIATRRAEIEKQMYVDGKQNPAYFGGPLEKEYRELIQAEETMKKRSNAA